MKRKKKPKITKEGKKIRIHLDPPKRFHGPNPAANKPGAGTHGGTVKQKNKRDRKKAKENLRKEID